MTTDNLQEFTLLVLRHAKSGWDNPALTDFERPLNKRGLKAAPTMGRFLRESNLIPDAIFSSTANRAQTTTRMVVEAGEFSTEPVYCDDLYLAPPANYCDHLATCPQDSQCVLVVGHNPGLEHLVRQLTGQPAQLLTATLAVIRRRAKDWSEFVAHEDSELVSITVARELE